MKQIFYLLIIISVLTFCDCNSIGGQKIGDAMTNKVFMQEVNDETKTTQQIFDKYLQRVLTFAKDDTLAVYYGENFIEDDSAFRQIMIGKFIDNATIFATEIKIKDTMINFYYLDNNNWKLLGREKTNIPIYKIDFDDLNGDGKNEIITSTSRNRNGNTWQEVYYYSDQVKKIKYAGSFVTQYEVKKDKKQLEETYTGSWYMDNSKTLYEWRKEMLVPIKKIILAHEQPVTENGKMTFKYYENSTSNMDGLRLIFKEPYNADNKQQQQQWDNFFNEL